MRDAPLFHYTIGYHMPKIYQDGALRACARHPGSSISVLWLSYHSFWDPSCVKTVTDDDGARTIIGIERLITRGRGIFRFEVTTRQRLYKWSEYVEMSGIDPGFAEHLDVTGRQGGANPDDWRVCLADIPQADWVRAQMLQPELREWRELK